MNSNRAGMTARAAVDEWMRFSPKKWCGWFVVVVVVVVVVVDDVVVVFLMLLLLLMLLLFVRTV